MWEWLKMYLVFAMAGGITTYFTVLLEANGYFKEITGENAKLIKYPIITFIVWTVAGVVLAPFWAIHVLTGNLENYRQSIAKGWLEDAGYND